MYTYKFIVGPGSFLSTELSKSCDLTEVFSLESDTLHDKDIGDSERSVIGVVDSGLSSSL